jgi:hypothetical protein
MPAESAAQSMRGFLDRYRLEAGRTAGGIIPVEIEVPPFGSAVFMAAELTAEGSAPVVELDYKRVRR